MTLIMGPEWVEQRSWLNLLLVVREAWPRELICSRQLDLLYTDVGLQMDGEPHDPRDAR